MSHPHYATPREDWPTRTEAAQEPPLPPRLSPADETALVAEVARLQDGAA